jgi:SP family facilitated glucose transporter-like MFS transporter 8
MFSERYRKRFFIACNLNAMQQLTGINFLGFFSTELFDKLSGNGSTMTLIIGAANVSGGLVGMYTLSKFGRKANILYGCALCFTGMLILNIGISLGSSIISALGVLVYMIFFAVGMGSVMPLYCAEIVPAAGVGIATAVQWLFATLVGKLVPILIQSMGA